MSSTTKTKRPSDVLGSRIAARRDDLGLSQRDLAALLDCDPSEIGRVESPSGERRGTVRVDFLSEIAVALKTTPNYLLGWTEDPAPLRKARRK